MRVLIINPFGIGDVLFSTPLINNIKTAYPQSYIGYICNIRAKDVLSSSPQIDEIFVFEKDEYRTLWTQAKFKCIKKFISFLKDIRRKKFDLAIDLSLGRQYNLFLWLIGIRKIIGYNYRNRGFFLTDKIDIDGYEDKPVADYYLDLLKFLNIEPRRFELTMNIPASDINWANAFFERNGLNNQDLVIGIIPAGGASWGKSFSYRHWSWKNYASLADKLITELKAKIVIFGDISEQNICLLVQRAMKNEAVSAFAKTSLKQFAACLGKCNLVVCNDGGPLHVAVSQNVMTVSIFGPVNEKVYGPYPSGFKHIIVTKDIDCRPCYNKFKLPNCFRQRQCITGISTEEVFNIIKEKLTRKERAGV